MLTNVRFEGNNGHDADVTRVCSAEAMELQTSYWRKQVGELAAQAEEMRTLTTEVTADVAGPIRAQVTRGMKGLHKET